MTENSSVFHPPYVVRFPFETSLGLRNALIDVDGNLVREPNLLKVHTFTPNGKGGYITAAQDLNEKWGYLDQNGRWLIEPILEDARIFGVEGMARFKKEGLWGYVDLNGEIKIQPRFEEALPFNAGLAAVRLHNGYAYIDCMGQVVIEGPFDEAGFFSPIGLAAVKKRGSSAWGVINTKGEMAIAPQFADVGMYTSDGTAPARKGKLWGLIDTQGEWIVKPTYSRIEEFNKEGLAFFSDYTDLMNIRKGYLNTKGDVVIEGTSISDQMVCGLVKEDVPYGGGIGFFDRTGTMVIPPQYAWADPFHECGASVVLHEEKWGILTMDGQFREMPYVEPLTDHEGWVLGFSSGKGVAPFLVRKGEVVYVDAVGREVCRLRVEETGNPQERVLRLFNAEGRIVWQNEGEKGAFFVESPFLCKQPARHFEDIQYWEGDITAAAQILLDAEPRDFYPYTWYERDVYDLSEEDEDEIDEHKKRGAMEVLAGTYVSEEHYGHYPFLGEWERKAFEQYFAAIADRLSDFFGDPLPDASIMLRWGDNNISKAWEVNGKYLVLEWFTEYGDGDFVHRLWLAAGFKEDLEYEEEDDENEYDLNEEGTQANDKTFDLDQFEKLVKEAQAHMDAEEHEEVLDLAFQMEELASDSTEVDVEHMSWIYDCKRNALNRLGRVEEALETCREAIAYISPRMLFNYRPKPRQTLRACHNVLARELMEHAASKEECLTAWEHVKACFKVAEPNEGEALLEHFYDTRALVLLKLSEFDPAEQAKAFAFLQRMQTLGSPYLRDEPRLAEAINSAEYQAFLKNSQEVDREYVQAPAQETAMEAVTRYHKAYETFSQFNSQVEKDFGPILSLSFREEMIAKAEEGLGFALPDALRQFMLVPGLVHGIYPELVPPMKIQGMFSLISDVWGVRREFEERLTRKELHWLEVHCQICGLSQMDEHSQEYMYFTPGKGFGTFIYTRDDWDEFEANVLRPLLAQEIPNETFDQMYSRKVTDQIKRMIEVSRNPGAMH
ncbi:WG repeat-containing protein [Paenibacillus elgii]